MSHFMYIKTRKNFNTEYMRLGMDFKIIPSYVLIDIYIYQQILTKGNLC